MKTHRKRAAGVLKDLVRASEGLERALVSALGPLADAVVYEDREEALEAGIDRGGAYTFHGPGQLVGSQPAAPQHGAPLRLVIAGWYGMAHVKWLGAITGNAAFNAVPVRVEAA